MGLRLLVAALPGALERLLGEAREQVERDGVGQADWRRAIDVGARDGGVGAPLGAVAVAERGDGVAIAAVLLDQRDEFAGGFDRLRKALRRAAAGRSGGP